MKVRFKTGDIIVISALLLSVILLILCFNLPSLESATLLVVRYGGTESSYRLNENTEFVIKNNGYELYVAINNGSAFVKSSNCPDNTCVHTAAISQTGQVIACVPAGLALSISGEETDYDFIAG